MKRLSIAAALMVSMILTAGTAMAGMTSLPWHFYDTEAVITNYTATNGQPGKQGPAWGKGQNAHGVNGYKELNWGNKYASYFDVHSVDAKGDLDKKTTNYFKAIEGLYGYEANYLHVDIKNRNKDGRDDGYQMPGKIQMYMGSHFSWGDYPDKKNGSYQGFLGAYMDFYYLSGVKGDTDLVYLHNEFFRLGELTYGDTTYYFDVQIDISLGHKYVQLEGELYDQAYNHAISMGSNMAYGDALWGQYLGANDEVHFKFDLLAMTKDRLPKAPPVPVPGAVWLMGTGLAGLVAMRRKQKS